MSKQSFDALFVINQDVDFEIIAAQRKAHGFDTICLLTTHLLLPPERKQLGLLLPGAQLTIFSFAEFLDDTTMVECDRQAFEYLVKHHIKHEEFVDVFTRELLFHKSKAIYSELLQQYTFNKIYFWATPVGRLNLGVSYEFWQEMGGENLVPAAYYRKKRFIRWLLTFTFFQWLKQVVDYGRLLFLPIEVSILDDGDKRFIFYSLRRLHFVEGTKFKSLTYRNISFFRLFAKNNKQSFYERFVKSLHTDHKVYACIPLHQFDTLYHVARPPEDRVLIFEDAFRPSNYPHYYYVDYFPYGTFVCRDMYDYELFRNRGREARRTFSFLKDNYFRQQSSGQPAKVESVIAMLNHAGDWTGLINRYDTDIIVDVFIFLARQFTQQQFIIRFHPTMTQAKHEGLNSLKRMKRLIDEIALPNLEVSEVSLEADWERGDIFITEYSLSLLDVMRQGKIGVFTNFTRRRSFVQDYIDLGLPCPSTREELAAMLSRIIAAPETYLEQQSTAMAHYNERLSAFYEAAVLNT